MQGNHRGPIYGQVQALLGRVLTPDERTRLDKLLDSFGAPSRFG